MAIEFVRDRRNPTNPEVMHSECELLSALCKAFDPCIHGFSTTVMVSMFSLRHLVAKLGHAELFQMMSFLFTGKPQYRSAFDGTPTPTLMSLTETDFEEFARDVLAQRDENVLSLPGDADAANAADDADDAMTGFDELFEEDIDVLAPTPIETSAFELPWLRESADVESEPESDVPSELESPLGPPLQPLAVFHPSAATPEPKHTTASAWVAPQRRDRKEWTFAEDEFVLDYFARHGPQWREMSREMAKTMPHSRSDDALRNRHERILAHLHTHDSPSSDSSDVSSKSNHRPRMSGAGGGGLADRPPRASWTPQEDEIICDAVSLQAGGKPGWQALARKLPGRTPHAVRNRANRIVMESERANLTQSP
jgi:hypothetical protein